MEWPADPNEYYSLYYIVNIRGKMGSTSYSRSELYAYNCKTKNPTLLLTIDLSKDNADYYDVDYFNGTTLLVVWRSAGMAIWPTEKILWFDIITKRKLFTLNNIPEVFPEGKILWFISGKWAWYIYYDSANYTGISQLYRIDKKTKKITKL